MPELPEVETIKNDLRAKVIGKKIRDVKILWAGVLNVPVKKFIVLVKNTQISSISRRAKILVIALSNNYSLLIHLKMTGQLIYATKMTGKISANPAYKYARLIFYFTDSSALIFNDLRKFGYIKIIPQKMIDEIIGKKKFGPEPLAKEFTLEKFKKILDKYPKRKIKQVLMDQAAIAGIGNIYADEICFYAKVMPTRQAGKLTNVQIEPLYKGIKKILSRAVELRGSSVENYVDASGKKGSYVKELKVYDREDEKCVLCPGKVNRIKIGGRSSYFCTKCQK